MKTKLHAKVRPNMPAAPEAKPKKQQGTFSRVMKALFRYYPGMTTITIVFLVINAVVSSVPAIFMENIYSIIEEAQATTPAGQDLWAAWGGDITGNMLVLIGMYAVSLIFGAIHAQLLAIITQGFLAKMREQMFDGMQDLPIRYFDTHNHGDIMSYYTNDIDSLRQMIAISLPQMLRSGVMVLTLFVMMLYYSVYLTLIVVVGIVAMTLITKVVGGGSGKYFLEQQRAIGKTEGFIEEMMNGQKVVKVFCHEEEAKRDFDRVNDHLFESADRANRYANMLMPIIMNVGHIMYVIVALCGAFFMISEVNNLGILEITNGAVTNIVEIAPFSVAVVVAFLQMSRQFSNNVGQVSQQVNSIVMGLAGAKRITMLIDEKPEADDGYVTLVNAKEDENGNITECEERTGMWAWKHPHHDGTLTYTKLEGDVRMYDVDFGYNPDKIVLHNITLYARPGQKVAFVGATGAGKTTIGQDDHHQPHQPLLRHCGRQDPLRRHQHQQDQEGGTEKIARHGAAGYQPLYGHGDGQHPLRQAGRDGRGVQGCRPSCRCGRLHLPPARRVRHHAHAQWRQPLAGAETASLHRPRRRCRPARHDPRRGDELYRYAHRGHRPARHG